jgi:branched-chain amino acid transport system permease protein
MTATETRDESSPAATPAGRRLAALTAVLRGEADLPRFAFLGRSVALPTVIGVLLGGLALGGVTSHAKLFVWYEVIVFAVFALSANVVVGWNGIGTFGHAVYFGAGAYTAGVLRDTDLPALLLLVIGGAVGATLGALFALLATRTGSLTALAMLTLMFAQLAYQIVFSVDRFGGENGIVGIPRGSLFGIDLDDRTAFRWYVVGVFGVCWYLLVRFRRSTVAHSMIAARDDPVRARAAGLNVKRLRILGFVIGGFFAGLAGILYAQTEGVVGPDLAYWTTSGTVLIMVIIGGAGRMWGPVVGAAVYSWVNFSLLRTTSAMNVYLGLALLGFLLLAPRGIAQAIVSAAEWCGRLVTSWLRRRSQRPGRTEAQTP